MTRPAGYRRRRTDRRVVVLLGRRLTGAWPFVVGFAVVLGLVALAGAPVDLALQGWFRGAFGSGFAIVQTLAYATPIALVGVTVALALQAGVITVGAEGQMVVGAVLATVVALSIGRGLPVLLAIPLGAVAGAVGGVLWALPAAVAKARWQVNEILVTLLMNYVAVFGLAYLLRTHLRDPDGSATPQSADLPAPFLLPVLPLPGRLHVGVLLVVAVVLTTLWWRRGRTAFLLGVHGSRPLLAARLGLSRLRAVVGTMAVSGAAAGVAGWLQLAGVDHRLQPGVSAGIGFAGLAVAVLGRGHPVGIVVAAVAYASLTTGATGIQVATGTVPTSIGTVTQGVLLLAAALSVARETRRRRATPAAGPAPTEPREPREPLPDATDAPVAPPAPEGPGQADGQDRPRSEVAVP